jgi:hypothetical protein
MRLCTCGHRDARHDQLDGEVRGECMACSCTFFEDAKSSIEEEIGLGQIVEIAETPALRKLREAFPFAPVATEQEIAAHLAAGNDIVRVVRPAEVDVAVLDGPALIEPVSSLTDLDVLERFEAWRCAVCGSRSWRQIRCEVLPKCRSRWLEPVTVEIRRRSP